MTNSATTECTMCEEADAVAHDHCQECLDRETADRAAEFVRFGGAR